MKTLLNKITTSVFTFSLLVLISSGCEDEMPSDPSPEIKIRDYLLRATFESDVVGQQPNKTLPGHPTGDELQYNETPLNLFVVNADGQKSVRLANSTFESSSILFRSKTTPVASGDAIQVTWSGEASYDADKDRPGVTTVDFRDDSQNFLSFFTLTSNRIWFSNYSIDAQGVLLEHHTFTLTFYLQLKTYSLKVVGESGTVITEYGIPFGSQNPLPSSNAKYLLWMNRDNDGDYTIDYATVEKIKYIGPINPGILNW